MNDPLENKPWQFPPTSLFRDDQDKAESLRRWLRFRNKTESIWNSAKLLALTEDAAGEPYLGKAARYGKAWARARMWDQYADRHRGVCLLFDPGLLNARVQESLGSQQLPRAYAKQVRYSPSGPFPSILSLSLSADELDRPKGVERFIEDHHEELFYVKALDWEGEREFRYVVTDHDHIAASDDDGCIYVDYGDALLGVVIGEKFPDEEILRAREVCLRAGANPAALRWASGGPTLLQLRSLAERNRMRAQTAAELASLGDA